MAGLLFNPEDEVQRIPVIRDPQVAAAVGKSVLAQMHEDVADMARPSSGIVEDAGQVAMLDRDGNLGTIPSGRVKEALAAGFTYATPEANREQVLQNKFGDSPVSAALEGAARSTTFGASDVLLSGLLGEGVAERKARNSGAAMLGEVGGMLTGAGAAGLIGQAGAAAGSRVAGSAAVEALAGGGLASRAVAKAAQYGAQAATEGALMGAQQTVTEVALSEDPMNAEAIAASLGSNMLYGGLAGGAAGGSLGGLGAVAKGAAQRLRSATTKWADREAALAAVPDDIAKLDAKAARAALGEEKAALRTAKDTEFGTLRAERDAEIEALKTGQKAERAAVSTELLPFRETLREAGNGLPALMKKHDLAGSGLVREFISTERRLASVLDAVETSPMRGIEALKGVERTARAARQSFDDMLEAQRAAIKPNASGGIMVDRELRGFSTPLAGETVEQHLARVRADVQIPRDVVPYLAKLDGVAERAGALRSRLEAATTPVASPKLADLETKLAGFDRTALASERMTALEGHLENLANPTAGRQLLGALGDKATGMGAGAALGMVGLGGGPLGALAGAGVGWGLGVLKKRMAATAGGWQKLITEGLDRAVSGAVVAAPTVARSVAIGASFGARSARGQSLETRAMDVIEAVADMDATRSQVREGLAGIRAADPDLAQQVEDQAMRRLDYLAKVAPKNPGMGGLAGGADRWRPADAELAKFARAVATSEQPLRLLDELASDTLTPQTVECVRTVYPEMFERLKVQLLDKLVEPGRKPLSPARHLNLTMLTGTPTDSRLKPEFVLRQQQAWEQMRQESEQARQKPKPPAPSQSRAAMGVTDLKPTASQTPI